MSLTVLRLGPYRFFFYSNEGFEPPHVHIQRDSNIAEFWLDPLELAYSRGIAGHDLTRLRGLVEAHKESLLEAWHEFFRESE